ncbi:DNA repair protein RecO [Undibacterium sp. LX40W]|uniref:DNA repair protein RecO n=1 Tax=Undibacterium nitidum TaxID=2762298 RepID=A0A923KVK7_9BURK|nr:MULTISPECIES: DNA repair protein RecO [Undibacterium]MBC3883247.1 DNA repair protein RecO [Undibacterium nitidum]MBC3893529.1 DNA repair protein RecO [Undibacterium sp. LX40W]
MDDIEVIPQLAPGLLSVAPPKRTQRKDVRVTHQPGFVLHSYPYKETSLIIDLFSRDFGRVSLVAKGAKRPHSKLRSVLQTFQPLTVAWSGKSEVRTLIGAEWVGGMLPLEKSALLCGFYLNELLTKFLLRNEACQVLFDHYVSTLNQLAHGESAMIALRKFELVLLQQAGLLGDVTTCILSRARVQNDRLYVLDPGSGARPAFESDTVPKVYGKTLTDMENGSYSDPVTQAQSKQLMRYLLHHHLHGQVLKTRQILIDLQKL